MGDANKKLETSNESVYDWVWRVADSLCMKRVVTQNNLQTHGELEHPMFFQEKQNFALIIVQIVFIEFS